MHTHQYRDNLNESFDYIEVSKSDIWICYLFMKLYKSNTPLKKRKSKIEGDLIWTFPTFESVVKRACPFIMSVGCWARVLNAAIDFLPLKINSHSDT